MISIELHITIVKVMNRNYAVFLHNPNYKITAESHEDKIWLGTFLTLEEAELTARAEFNVNQIHLPKESK